jgi:hypothetical protein
MLKNMHLQILLIIRFKYIYIYIYGVSECLTMNSAISYWQTLPARSMHGKSKTCIQLKERMGQW